jgi:hypothetical protein
MLTVQSAELTRISHHRDTEDTEKKIQRYPNRAEALCHFLVNEFFNRTSHYSLVFSVSSVSLW